MNIITSQKTSLVSGLEYRSLSVSVVSLFSPSVSQSVSPRCFFHTRFFYLMFPDVWHCFDTRDHTYIGNRL